MTGKAAIGSETGQSMVEYALIIGIVIIGLIAILFAFQGVVIDMYDYIIDEIAGAIF